MKHLYRFTSFALLFAASIQWLGIGERITHGLWMWYKFHDYSGNGHTTVSADMLWLVSLGSAALIAIGVFVNARASDKVASKLSGVSAASLFLGLVSLSVLLVSPIGQVR